MNKSEVIEQLKSLKENSESYTKAPDADAIWQKDIEALDIAIAIVEMAEVV